MAGTSRVYPATLQKWLNESTNPCELDTGTFEAMLVDTDYVFADAHDFVNDVSGNEITVTGDGRPNITVTQASLTADTYIFDGNDVSMDTVPTAQVIGGVLVYKYNTGDTDSPVISYNACTNKATDGGDVDVTWGGNGIFRAICTD